MGIDDFGFKQGDYDCTSLKISRKTDVSVLEVSSLS